MKLEIDSEKVLEAAEKCPEWKDGLKTLFPEAFEKEGLSFLVVHEDGYIQIEDSNGYYPFLDVNRNKGFILLDPTIFDYEIKGDRLYITEKD